ncbi:MAG: SRPBCC family protein [Deltaproteobacteria bacterium]|nr:SRPBCC family protein [Deltaproteobacteria bacterium]
MKFSKKNIYTLITAITFLISSTSFAVTFSKDEKARLKQGKSVVQYLPSSGQKGFYGGAGYIVVNAPVEKVWSLIRNWDLYSKMFPHTEYCKIVSKKDGKTLVKMKIGHPVINIHYHAQITEDDSKKTLDFELVSNYPHDLDMLKGYWRLFPQKGGKTLIAYVVSVKAPMGIVSIAGPELAQSAIDALLSIPGDVKAWLRKHP